MTKISFWLNPKQFVFEYKCIDCLKEWVSNESDKIDTFRYRFPRCPICRKEMDKWYQSIKENIIEKFICPKCKGGCVERKIEHSLVYDCKECGDQISKEAIIRK